MYEDEIIPKDRTLPKVKGLCRMCYFTRPKDPAEVCDHPDARVISCSKHRPREARS